jgi:hypothetical protein
MTRQSRSDNSTPRVQVTGTEKNRDLLIKSAEAEPQVIGPVIETVEGEVEGVLNVMVVPKTSQAKDPPIGPDEAKADEATPPRDPIVESQDDTMVQDDPYRDESTAVSSTGQDQH